MGFESVERSWEVSVGEMVSCGLENVFEKELGSSMVTLEAEFVARLSLGTANEGARW